jgi:hypothetical protein
MPAWSDALIPCSTTITTTAVAVPFGSRAPTKYLEICNAHATNTLGVNATGGAAVIGASGTRTLAAGQCAIWTVAPPTDVSVIGSAASTTFACGFR